MDRIGFIRAPILAYVVHRFMVLYSLADGRGVWVWGILERIRHYMLFFSQQDVLTPIESSSILST